MDVALLSDILIQSFDSLDLRERAQRGDGADLRLSARKHSASVNSRDKVHLSGERTYLIYLSAIRSLVILEDHLTDGLLLILIHRVRKICKIIFPAGPCLLNSLSQHTDVVLSLLLDISEDSLLHLLGWDKLFQSVKDFFRNRKGFICVLRLADFGNDLIDEVNDRQVDVMALVDRLDHLIFFDLVGARLDHDDLGRG